VSTIICGSKRYSNFNFDNLVDSFDVIVRHNMLLPNHNYGKKNSNYQILNPHIYARFTEKVDFSVWVDQYSEVHGLTEEHIQSFLNYLETPGLNIVNYGNNNTGLMMNILHQNGINHNVVKQIRCGFGHMAECINRGNRPFVVGFALNSEYALNKQYASKDGTGECHNIEAEIELVKKLHKAKLIDATFCAIKDTSELSIDETMLEPTVESLEILEKIYE